jgi:hypothetical protein
MVAVGAGATAGGAERAVINNLLAAFLDWCANMLEAIDDWVDNDGWWL